MSVDLDWALLSEEITEQLRVGVNEQLQKSKLPDFLESAELLALDIGDEAPEVTLSHIGDVWECFDRGAHRASAGTDDSAPRARPIKTRLRTYRQYEHAPTESVHTNADSDTTSLDGFDDSMTSAAHSELGDAHHAQSGHTASYASLPSLQTHLSVQWLTTSVRLEVAACVRVAFTTGGYMRLPVHLALTALELAAQVVVALDGDRRCLHVSITEDGDEAPTDSPGMRRPTNGRAGQRILPFLAFDSRVGEPRKHVLENVGKVEKFFGDTVRGALEDELVYPNFYTIYLPPET